MAQALRRIVVGYDGSPAAREAVAFAARTTAGTGSLLVVHAFGPPATPGERTDFQEAVIEYRRHGAELLDRLASDPDGPLAGVEYEFLLTGGSPAEQLLQAARRHSAEQIVVGSRGLGPLQAALGSVSHELVHLTDRPVVVVPLPAHGHDDDQPAQRAAKETAR